MFFNKKEHKLKNTSFVEFYYVLLLGNCQRVYSVCMCVKLLKSDVYKVNLLSQKESEYKLPTLKSAFMTGRMEQAS